MESKKWYLSKTIWASIFTVIASLGGTLGVTISPDLVDELALSVVTALNGICALVAIWGRISAKKAIDLK